MHPHQLLALQKAVRDVCGDSRRDVRLSCLGIGSSVSTELVESLAQLGRGRALFANVGDINATCQQLLTAGLGGSLRDVRVVVEPFDFATRVIPSFLAAAESEKKMVFADERVEYLFVVDGTEVPADATLVLTAAPLPGSDVPL